MGSNLNLSARPPFEGLVSPPPEVPLSLGLKPGPRLMNVNGYKRQPSSWSVKLPSHLEHCGRVGPVTVLLMGGRETQIGLNLPRCWTVRLALDPAALVEGLFASDIVFVSIPPHVAFEARETVDVLFHVNESTPVFICSDLVQVFADFFRHAPPFPLQFVQRGDDLGELVVASKRPILKAFQEALVSCVPQADPILLAAIRTFLEQRPGWPPDPGSRERQQNSHFGKTVSWLAKSVGSSTGYLRRLARSAGMSLHSFVSWGTILHGLTLYSPHLRTWTVVADRLGFSDLAAFSHFCSRTSGLSPTGLIMISWRELVARGLDAILATP